MYSNNNKCHCGLIAKQGTTSKGENQGRKYTSCSKSMTDKSRCKFFKWLDSSEQTATTNISSSSSSFKSNSKLQHSEQAFDDTLNKTIQLMNRVLPSSLLSSTSGSSSSSSNNKSPSNNTNSQCSSLTLSQLCSSMEDLNIDKDLSKPSSSQAIDRDFILNDSLFPSSSSEASKNSLPLIGNNQHKGGTSSSSLPNSLLEECMQKELNSKQLEAVCASEHDCVCVYSGPGSGKTKTITNRIAYLCIVKGIEPRNVFAMTFTNKAAQEMKTRLVHLVKLYDFQKRINAKDFSHIGTFHAVCANILRNEMHHLTRIVGLDQKFMIFDSEEQLS
ncbi:predicted protein [Naegleria gruberi]|uniref:Predicted protein n=1 Tax=Naegleria gruberi TaxID=5762 RepID=D2W2R5_NAEGR|nr:uncharacterized protein NAEGRDRAFT_75682 [Naegleria gruberi]EFC36664.1 predicted protein [Naegleria gruberi]|eukprot:XP_002669408.1 predicted protein [Naegleria gruberi strain NEG-M]